MKYSNEIKVGLSIIVAIGVFFVGFRFFQDIPLFQERYTMQVEFEDAGGIVQGNPVRMKGVSIGTVQSVTLDQQEQVVRVRFRVDDDVPIPEGSYAEVTGFSALSGVRLSITPGPPGNPRLPPGSTLPGPPEGDILERLSDQAPVLATKTDSLLSNANVSMRALSRQLKNPESDLRRTLQALNGTMQNVETITQENQQNLRKTIDNLQAITRDLKGFTSENGDTLGVAVRRLNRSLASLETSLNSLETTTASLDTLTTKMNRGDGTIGRLVNDPGLYNKLDSAAARTNRLLLDVQRNPSRYLEDMTLMRVF
jgi:phospholipid/cholesterol/gamma-HCH transport system substrate-binding protein